MRRWDVGDVGTCRLGCIVGRKLSCEVGERRCRRRGRRSKGFYGANMSIFGGRGSFIAPKFLQVKVLDEVFVSDRRSCVGTDA